MKEIKAYVRSERVNDIIQALEKAGVKGMTLIDVMAVGQNIDPKNYKFSMSLVERYQKIAKLEIICSDDDVDQYVQIIRENGTTHSKGDGLITVSDVQRLVKVRNGVEGEEAL